MRISTDILRGVEKILEIPSFGKKFSVNAVNDGSLPTNVSEDAQQSSGTDKISASSSVHTFAFVFLLQ